MKLFLTALLATAFINLLVGCNESDTSFSDDTTEESYSVSSLYEEVIDDVEDSADEVVIEESNTESLSDEEILYAVADKVELKIEELESLDIQDEEKAERIQKHIEKLEDFLIGLEEDSDLQDNIIKRVANGEPLFKKRKRKRKGESAESDSDSDSQDTLESDQEENSDKYSKKRRKRKPMHDLESLCEKIESKLSSDDSINEEKLERLQMIYEEKCD